MSEQKYVVRLANSRGHHQWYRSLATRMQAEDVQHAAQFSQGRAEEVAAFCRNQPSCMPGIFWDAEKGGYDLTVTVEPAPQAQ